MNKPPSRVRAEGVGVEHEGEGEGKGREEEQEEEQEVGLLEAGGDADRRAASVASEQNAFLLGWVRLALIPPPSLPAAAAPMANGAEKFGPEGGENRHPTARTSDDDRGGAGLGEPATIAVALVRHSGAQNGRAPGNGNGSGTRKMQEELRREPERPLAGRRKRRKKASCAGSAKAPQSKTTTTTATLSGVKETLTGDEDERRGRTATKRETHVVLADPDQVWFHVPSARLVSELPEEWVAFTRISGGVLADVSIGAAEGARGGGGRVRVHPASAGARTMPPQVGGQQ